MTESDPDLPSADGGADGDDSVVVRRQTTADSRRRNYIIATEFLVPLVPAILAGVIWHRTPAQMTWIYCGTVCLFMARRIWARNRKAVTYSPGQTEETRAAFPRWIVVPLVLLLAAVFFLAATPTPFGEKMSSILDPVFEILLGL